MDNKMETDRRIQQMVAFIRQEARDKAEEIEVRAKEECNVEVMRMVDKEKTKMREEFKQRMKRVEVENKIARQKLLDGFRMELLKAEDQKKQELETMVQKEFSKVVKSGGYKNFLKEAMMQAFLLIWDEDEVQVSCRKKDADIVKSLIQSALGEVKQRAKSECQEELTMKATFNPEPIKCSGGVKVTARGGKIVCDNTLDARLKIVMRTQLPMVRERLFGKGVLGSS